ncbi:hypothetical protein KEM56_001411, partial [Ascosphaera pollenicola]
MPSFTRIFKHSHKDKDRDREKENQNEPLVTAPAQGTAATTKLAPAIAEPSSPDYAQAFYSSKGKKKKDKKDKNSNDPGEVARRAEKEKQRFAELKRLQEVESDAWQKTSVDPCDVVELLNAVSKEIKARALDIPFLLLPFRPSATSSDLASTRTFIRHYFKPPPERSTPLRGEALHKEVKLVDPPVLCSLLKWCWARLKGGVVGWEVYSLFKVGEQDSDLARTAFSTFIPIAVDSVRAAIINDFFDLLASIAAHSKSNGLAGRKLSRYAGWWAFQHVDTSAYVAATSSSSTYDPQVGFQASYNNWEDAANATSHLFFAYLRSLTPDPTLSIQSIPTSLRSLERDTEYPPKAPALLRRQTIKVVMVVSRVSATPFALLRRATGYDYEDVDVIGLDSNSGKLLQRFTNLDNPAQQGLTEECVRLLKAISKANHSTFGLEAQSSTAKSTFAGIETQEKEIGSRPSSPSSVSSTSSLNIASLSISNPTKHHTWSRFEDLGFDGVGFSDRPSPSEDAGRKSQALERPHTPSWADFLSSGFADDATGDKERTALQLPHDNVLPPLAIQKEDGHPSRGRSSQSHVRRRPGGSFDIDAAERKHHTAPGELANVTTIELDDSFFWVWISSLAPEETPARKGVFGRCALVETKLSIDGGNTPSIKSDGTSADSTGNWFVFEEQIKGAAPKPDETAVVVERKGTLFGLRHKLTRSTKRRSLAEPVSPSGGNQKASISTNAITEFGGMTGLSADPQVRPRPSMAVSIAPDQHARIQAAAAALQKKKREAEAELNGNSEGGKRKRHGDQQPENTHQRKKTESIPVLSEVSEALKWAMMYDQRHDELNAVQKVPPRKPVGNRGLTVNTGVVQRSISGPALRGTEKHRNSPPIRSAGNSTETQRSGSPSSSAAAANSSASRSVSSPFPPKPASLAPSTNTTTTVMSRSIIATDADLSETTPRGARSRPEPVKIPPPVLASPSETPLTARGGTFDVAGHGANHVKGSNAVEGSSLTQGINKPLEHPPKGAIREVERQQSVVKPAQQTTEPKSRSTSRGPASGSAGGSSAGGLVAAKRAALEQRDAAAKALPTVDRKGSSPLMSPTRSGSRSPSESSSTRPKVTTLPIMANMTLPSSEFMNFSSMSAAGSAASSSSGSAPGSSAGPAGSLSSARSQPTSLPRLFK